MSHSTKYFAAIVLAVGLLGCKGVSGPANGLKPAQTVYDPKTGRLTLLTYDSNKDGRIDTWTHMDGTTVIRIDIDQDGDGKIDRWEYYRNQRIEKVGFSRAKNGSVDAWAYPGPDGLVARVEIAGGGGETITRTEYYEKGALVRAEESTRGDGLIDKWETYANGAVSSVAFDTKHRGSPDQRITYLPDGQVKTETLK